MWLDQWEDFLRMNLGHCRIRGISDQEWLETLQSLDTKYIGADWMVWVPEDFLG